MTVQTHLPLPANGSAVGQKPLAQGGEGASPDVVNVLDIAVDNVSMAQAIRRIMQLADEPGAHQVCFVNADCANIAYGDSEYRRILHESDLVLADGIGMKLAGKLLGSEVRENVNGTDMFPLLCGELAAAGKGVYLLGGRPGVAGRVAEWIGRNFPRLTVSGHRHGYYQADELDEVIRSIADSGAAVLLVAQGVPMQEKWISEHGACAGVAVAIGVGGLFDFYSGQISRAPGWMRGVGMEWFFRFMQEPGRMWRRYFVGNGQFLARVAQQRRGLVSGRAKRSREGGS